MKKRIFLSLITILNIIIVVGQSIHVNAQYELVLSSKSAFNSVLSPDGAYLLYSTANFQGLHIYDFKKKSDKVVSTGINAGYDPLFANENSEVYYRNSRFESGKRYDLLESFNVKSGNRRQLLEPQRNLRTARSTRDGLLIQTDDKQSPTAIGRTKALSSVYVSTEDLKIFVYANGRRTELRPIIGENVNYIWVSLSPDQTKILFTAMGKGTYICDLSGKIIAKLAYLNAPVWYNDKFVVGMQDKDNGDVVTSSIILMISIDTKIKKQISNPSHIAINPSAAGKAGKIAYSTLNGRIVISEISIK